MHIGFYVDFPLSLYYFNLRFNISMLHLKEQVSDLINVLLFGCAVLTYGQKDE
jgi:hypothetical protein